MIGFDFLKFVELNLGITNGGQCNPVLVLGGRYFFVFIVVVTCWLAPPQPLR